VVVTGDAEECQGSVELVACCHEKRRCEDGSESVTSYRIVSNSNANVSATIRDHNVGR
jgi:hypothetical protein